MPQKFLEIAASRYELPEELEIIMRSDCLMALGFYDRVVELFKELQQESPDPILEYDLAVSTFHLLRFEEAAEHLQAYTQYFSQSHTATHKADDLRKLIECFRTHTPAGRNLERASFYRAHMDKADRRCIAKGAGFR